jgi:hypothetical protein
MAQNFLTQKNPFMSAWLSAANSSLSAGRGLWMAEARRQQTAMMAEFNKQVMNFWTGAWMARPATATAASVLGTAELPFSREAVGKKAAAPLRATVARRTASPAKRTTRSAR